MNKWMLLEPREQPLAESFRRVDYPDFVSLFDTTELSIYSELGPLLIADDSDALLSQWVHQVPAEWPGLIIESEHSSEDLRAHLRHILIVRFEQTRKGVLRYWNPKVAASFFPACTDENLTDWLGPISRLQWHSPCVEKWQTLDNPYASQWRSSAAKPLSISVEQRQALDHLFQAAEPSTQGFVAHPAPVGVGLPTKTMDQPSSTSSGRES